MLFSAAPLYSMPFSRKMFCCGRLPENSEIICSCRVGDAGAASLLRGEIHDAGVERKK